MAASVADPQPETALLPVGAFRCHGMPVRLPGSC